MIVISKSISSEDFLNNGDFSDAIINLKLRNGIVVEIYLVESADLEILKKLKCMVKNFH